MGHTPELSKAPAQPREPALSLSGHGAAVPGAEASAGASAAAAPDTAPGAAGGAVPRALQLPSGRRPALPWPAGRPQPTVSTPCLQPAILTRSGSPFLPTRAPFTWKFGKRHFAPFKLYHLLGGGEAKAWGLSLPYHVRNRVFGPHLLAHPPASSGPQIHPFSFGAVARGVELPRSHRGKV